MSTAATASKLAREQRATRVRKLTDRAATVILWALAMGVVAIILAIVVYLLVRGTSALSWHFIKGLPAETTPGGGIGPEIFN